MCPNVLQCVAMCCSVLLCRSRLSSVPIRQELKTCFFRLGVAVWDAVCCSVLQCVAVCYRVLQCVADMEAGPSVVGFSVVGFSVVGFSVVGFVLGDLHIDKP